MASEAVRELVEESGVRIVKGRDEVGASWPKIARVIGLSDATKDTEVDHAHIRMVRAAYKVAKGTAPASKARSRLGAEYATAGRKVSQGERADHHRRRISGGSNGEPESKSKAAARRVGKAEKLAGLTSEEIVAKIVGRRIRWNYAMAAIGTSELTPVAKVRDVGLGREDREVLNFWTEFDAKTGEATGPLRSCYIDQIVEVS
jgi:hypothetical protein